MVATFTIQNADTALLDTIKSVIKLSPKAKFSVKQSEDDGFYSEANIRHLEEQVKLYNEGKVKLIPKTFQELGIKV